jgi:hypothetical protein
MLVATWVATQEGNILAKIQNGGMKIDSLLTKSVTVQIVQPPETLQMLCE